MKNKTPTIYAYNNFRNYLMDYQKARQAYEPSFTKSEFSRMLLLPNTRSYLNDVLKGKKVTSTFIERFVRVLQFDKDEALFFRALVKFNQAESVDERELYFEQLISLNKSPKKIIDKNAYSYYKDWYNSVIRALLSIYNFNGNYAELAKKVYPAITAKQAQKSIMLLMKLGLIKKDATGYLKPTELSISTSEYVRDEMIKQYQLQCLDIAINTIIKGTKNRFVVTTNILSISENGLKRLEKKIGRFRSEVRSLIQKDEKKPEKVYHLEIILLPNSN